MSAEPPSNISPNPFEVIYEVLEPRKDHPFPVKMHRDSQVRDTRAAEETDGDDRHGVGYGDGETQPDADAGRDEAEELHAGAQQRGPLKRGAVHDVTSTGQARGGADEPLYHLAGDRLPHHPRARPRHWGGPNNLVQPRLQRGELVISVVRR